MVNTGRYDQVTINGFQYKCLSFSAQELPYFAQQRREGLPTFQNYVPEVATLWDSWHLGYQQLYYDGSPTYYTANGIDASILRQLTLALAACSTGQATASVFPNVQQFIEFNQSLYAVGSINVYKWNPNASPNGWVMSASFGSQVLGQATVYSVASLAGTASLPAGNYLIVPGASYQNFLSATQGATWVTVGTMAAHLQTIRNEMWKTYYDQAGNWQIAKTTDGITYPNPNSISTLADVGAATITSLVNYDNRLFLYGTNGLTTLDSSGTVYAVAAELGSYTDNRAMRNAAVFHGLLYIPSDFGIFEYTGSVVLNPQTQRTITSIGPDTKSWSQSAVRGHFHGLAPDVNYLYGTMTDDAGNGYLMKYRDYSDAQPGQGWHPIQTFPNAGGLGIQVSQLPWYGTPYPVLWFSMGSQIYHINLPSQNDNPLTASFAIYQPQGTIDLPILDDAMPPLTKTYIRYVVEFVAPSLTNVAMFAQYGQNGTFNAVGGAISATTATFEFDFPYVGAQAFNIQPRLQLTASVTGAVATQTPYVRSIVLHHLIRPVQRQLWDLQISADQKVMPNDQQTPFQKLQNLRAARNTPGPIVFYDLFGNGHLATVEQLSWQQSARLEGSGPMFTAKVQLESYAVTQSLTMSAFTMISFTQDTSLD